jgi:hypothetical protein
VVRFIKRCSLTTALVLASILMAGPSAHAADTGFGAFALEGGGTIAPGLTTTPTSQTQVTFGGQIVGGSVDTTSDQLSIGAASCLFSGASTIAETVVAGAGSGTATCTGTGVNAGSAGNGIANIALTAACDYSRMSTIVVVTCTATITDSAPVTTYSIHIPLTIILHFLPTSVNPTVSYNLAGVGEGGV